MKFPNPKYSNATSKILSLILSGEKGYIVKINEYSFMSLILLASSLNNELMMFSQI